MERFDYEKFFLYQTLVKKYDVEICDDPDYLFYSGFGLENLNYDCVKICYTGENICPDFNLCDYGIGFEYLEYGDRYLRFPNLYSSSYKDCFKIIDEKVTKEEVESKEFCSFVYSNGNANPIREKFFDELSKYKQVSSGGRFKNNVGGPVPDKLEFQSKYKFCIAFENSSHPGYTTEKLLEAFGSKSLPIYWGDPKVTEVFNKDAFLIVDNEKDIPTVIEKIKFLDENIEEYLKYINAQKIIKETEKPENKYKELEDFLDSIFEKNLEEAKRYNRDIAGRNYIYMLKNNNIKKSKIKKILKKILKRK